MMGIHLGKRVGSPRLLSPAVAAESKYRGCTVEQVLPARRGADGGSVHPSTSTRRRQFASASFGTYASVARKRGAERIGGRASCGPFPRCVAVQVAQQGSARERMHTVHTHTQRRPLSSRDGFGGGQHFPHSDQVRQSVIRCAIFGCSTFAASLNVYARLAAAEPSRPCSKLLTLHRFVVYSSVSTIIVGQQLLR